MNNDDEEYPITRRDLAIGLGTTATLSSLGFAGLYLEEIREWLSGGPDQKGKDSKRKPTTPKITRTPSESDGKYNLGDFTEDLSEEDRQSRVATKDFFATAYHQEGDISEAYITEDEKFVVNGLAANLDGEKPGLGYSEEFRDTLTYLDNQEKLTDIVEKYTESRIDEYER